MHAINETEEVNNPLLTCLSTTLRYGTLLSVEYYNTLTNLLYYTMLQHKPAGT